MCLGDSHLFVFRDELPPVNAAHARCHTRGSTRASSRVPRRAVSSIRSPIRTRSTSSGDASSWPQPWQPVVFQLGEVDCGFLIWFSAKQHGRAHRRAARATASRATSRSSTEVRARGFEQLYVLSAPLPTIAGRTRVDGDRSWRAASIRDVSQRDRTDLTLRYNAELARLRRRLHVRRRDRADARRRDGADLGRVLNRRPATTTTSPSEPYSRARSPHS